MAGGGARAQKNKAHKTRFASKSFRHAHKTDKAGARGPTRVTTSAAAARALRMQRNKDLRERKRAQVVAEKRSSHGLTSAPRILALVALSAKVRLDLLRDHLLASSVDEVGTGAHFVKAMEQVDENQLLNLETVALPKFKIRLTVITAPYGDVQALLEVLKVADIVAFVTAATGEKHEEFVDSGGKKSVAVLQAQGSASTVGLVLGLSSISTKKQAETKKTAIAAMQEELSENTKIFLADTGADCQQVLRYLSEKRLMPPVWRSQRPYVLAQQVHFAADASTPGRGTLQLCGYVRGRGLSVNQLVHVPGAGDFQLEKIDLLEDPYCLRSHQRTVENSGAIEMLTDEAVKSLSPSPGLQEPLVIANVPDALAGEQTWPTEAELNLASKSNAQRVHKKRVPKGTSKYQASWILEDEGSDLEAEDASTARDDEMADVGDLDDGPERKPLEEDAQSVVSEVDASEVSSICEDDEAQCEMMDDEELTGAPRDGELQQLKDSRSENEEFPDDVDTPVDVAARQRFVKYRGLKSFRTSTWDPKESLPSEYARIFAFQNLTRTRKFVMDVADQVDQGTQAGCVGVGTFVRLHIANVPSQRVENLVASRNGRLLVACGLLRHESKMSVVHLSVKKSEDYVREVRSKEELVFHMGFRQFSARPLFSTDSLNADKHKFERFLRRGQFLVGTVFAPIAFGPLPVVVLKDVGDGVCELVASGSLKTVDPDRIILKKIVLSGYPQRVSKRKAVVRFMFHNPEDVRWFKPVELWSRYGRRGRIQEPVGTHGAMKCIFDGVIQQRDSVCLSLYKRVYPKWPEQCS